MEQSTRPRAVVITGASSGIGEACALCLESKGMRVFAGVRKEADAIALSEKASHMLTPIILDVTDEKSIEAAAERVSNAVTGDVELDLVNNAGVVLGGPIEYLSLDELRKGTRGKPVGKCSGNPGSSAANPGVQRAHCQHEFGERSHCLPVSRAVFREQVCDGGHIRRAPDRVAALGDQGLAHRTRRCHTPIWDKSQSMIDRVTRHWPPKAFVLYGPAMAIRNDLKRHGVSPEAVAKVVQHALTNVHSRPRYRVGKLAPVVDLFRHLPIAIRDRVIATQLPKYGY